MVGVAKCSSLTLRSLRLRSLTLPDSFCAGTITIPDRVLVHSQERWFRRDFCSGAKLRRAFAVPISKVERYISDRFLVTLWCSGNRYSNVPLSFPIQCWATCILEHWDDCNTQINTGEGENHTSVSRFMTSSPYSELQQDRSTLHSPVGIAHTAAWNPAYERRQGSSDWL